MARSNRLVRDVTQDLDNGFHIVFVDDRTVRVVSPTIQALKNFHNSLPDFLEDLLSGNLDITPEQEQE